MPTLPASQRLCPTACGTLMVTTALFLLTPVLWPASGELAAQTASAARQAGQVASLLELGLGEYREAVEYGQVVDAEEYAETREFAAEAARLFRSLPDAGSEHGRGVALAIDSLIELVERKGDEDDYRTLAEDIGRRLADGWGAVSVPAPTRQLSAARGAELFRATCAACHGPAGRGDGLAAAELNPPPADLGSAERRQEATAARDYQVIAYGVPETAMPGSSEWLTGDEAWDLVAYVQTLRYRAAEVAEGKALALGEGSPLAGYVRLWSSPASSARLNDPELARRVRERWREGSSSGASDTLSEAQARSVVAYVRSLLGTPATGVPPTDRAVVLAERLAEADSLARVSVALFSSGRAGEARNMALRAYGSFEGVEPEFRARDAGLVSEIETAFANLRAAADGATAAAAGRRVAQLLGRAEDQLASAANVWSVVTQSFVTILREGFEAILIIGAILAFLMKTGHEERRRDVHRGVVVALLASLATAGLMEWALMEATVSREALEGAVMLVAVVVLFSVSWWLVAKLEHQKWQAYLQTKMRTALGAGSGLALGGVAFLAVYREGFETVLFYQAIAGYSSAGLLPVGAGFGLGCGALAVIYFLFTRYGVKLPMRPFFAGTSALLYAMAVIFAGSGIHELQEVGIVSMTPIAAAPRLDFLGIYPTLETLAAQGALLLLLAGALWWTFRPGPVPETGPSR